MTMIFEAFPKIPRINRDVIITEKIDGTNACIAIADDFDELKVGSRSRWITPEDDNFGFARWVKENEDECRKLGPGIHYGEWWGAGIQRKYGLTEKRFSLFNTFRWADENVRPKCMSIVPVLYQGPLLNGNFDRIYSVDRMLNHLIVNGSVAAPGFMKPEGVVIFHTASQTLFKATCEKDEKPKNS